jgi:tetratricopeptide (TPR) repeat protein
VANFVLKAYERGLNSGIETRKLQSSTLRRLADFYQAAGNFARAEELYMEILSRREELLMQASKEKVLTPEHTSTLQTVNNLGIVYRAQGRLAKAEAIYLQTLAGRERTLSPEHTSTLDTVSNLTGLYSDQGRFAEAEAMY